MGKNRRDAKKLVSLTRRHSPLCGRKRDHKNIFDLCTHYIGSHDMFIFEVPVSREITSKLDFTQDIGFGVENRVIWEFAHHGYATYNPCEMIHGFHYHCSQERKYRDKGIIISQARYNNGTRKHGWIKPYWWTNEFTCPFPLRQP